VEVFPPLLLLLPCRSPLKLSHNGLPANAITAVSPRGFLTFATPHNGRPPPGLLGVCTQLDAPLFLSFLRILPPPDEGNLSYSFAGRPPERHSVAALDEIAPKHPPLFAPFFRSLQSVSSLGLSGTHGGRRYDTTDASFFPLHSFSSLSSYLYLTFFHDTVVFPRPPRSVEHLIRMSHFPKKFAFPLLFSVFFPSVAIFVPFFSLSIILKNRGQGRVIVPAITFASRNMSHSFVILPCLSAKQTCVSPPLDFPAQVRFSPGSAL